MNRCDECKHQNSCVCVPYGCECFELTEHDAIEEELQKFAQWLWDNHYLVDEARTIRLVEQYKSEQMKEQKLCSNGKPCKHPKCNKCGTTHFMSECEEQQQT